MADYISREAALEAIKRQFLDTADARDIPLSSALVDVDAIPSADVERHGRWEVYVISMLDGEDIRCSECGKGFCDPSWAFCPHCGARMDGYEGEYDAEEHAFIPNHVAFNTYGDGDEDGQ